MSLRRPSDLLPYLTLILGLGLVSWGCGSSTPDTAPATTAAALTSLIAETTAAPTTVAATTTTAIPVEVVDIDETSFPALADMTPVRGFFIANVLGDLEGTKAVAEDASGGVYPIGSLVQLVPQEAMVKREPGYSPETNDWEFFELDVDETGTTIRVRGGAEVVNRFGGSCSACHLLAEPQYDLICEQDHGCDPLPLDRALIETIQLGDPRPVVG